MIFDFGAVRQRDPRQAAAFVMQVRPSAATVRDAFQDIIALIVVSICKLHRISVLIGDFSQNTAAELIDCTAVVHQLVQADVFHSDRIIAEFIIIRIERVRRARRGGVDFQIPIQIVAETCLINIDVFLLASFSFAIQILLDIQLPTVRQARFYLTASDRKIIF